MSNLIPKRRDTRKMIVALQFWEGDKAKATDVDSAISKYEQATNLDPQNHRILWKLALAYTKKEAWDKVAKRRTWGIGAVTES